MAGPAQPSAQPWFTGLHAVQGAPAGRGAFHRRPHAPFLRVKASVAPSLPYATISAEPSPSRSPAASDAEDTVQSGMVSPSRSTPPRFASREQSVLLRMRITPRSSVYAPM